MLGENPDFAVYDLNDVKKALQYGAVGTLILSKSIDKAILKELRSMAGVIGSTVETVSLDTEEGKQFDNISGIGAILRFKI
jgi:stalled ribosome rescue protein Dom34